MRTIILTLFILTLFVNSCKKEEVNSAQMGCQTGIPKGCTTNCDRIKLRCCTQAEALAGNNVNAGGVSYFSNYTDVKWEAIGDCKDCK